MEVKEEKTSQIISDFVHNLKNDSFTIYELIEALKERSFGILLFLMAIPNACLITVVPMVSSIFGLVLILVSMQMILRQNRIWLPKVVGQKTFSKKHFESAFVFYHPYLFKVEKHLKLRWIFLTSAFFETILGFICLVHGILITFPIPLANFLSGVTLVFFALGMIAKDGLFIVMGYILSIGVFVFFATSFSFVLKVVQGIQGFVNYG